MHIQYTRNFSVGQSTHIVKTFRRYTDEQGLDGLVDTFESTRMADILKALRGTLSLNQTNTLKLCMKEKLDVIVLYNGKIGR